MSGARAFPVRRRRAEPWGQAVGVLACLPLVFAPLFVVLGEQALIVRLGVYAAPWIAGLAALTCTWALFCRSWLMATAMGLIAGALFAPQAATVLRPDGSLAVPDDAISVLSLSNRTRNADMRATAAVLRVLASDIMVLQEIADPPGLLAELEALYEDPPPQACHSGNFVVLSRYPVGPPHPASTNRMLFCPVALPGGSVTVGSIHLPRAVLESHSQDEAVSALLAALRAIDRPLILAGDFNSTPMAAPMRKLGAHLGNAFDEAGRGFGFTFPTPARRLGTFGPVVRIDHILTSADFTAFDAAVLDEYPPGADHFPVRARIVRNREMAR